MAETIVYIKRNDIDTQKWNRCIKSAANGLIYGRAEYLDALCENWDAIIINDYESVVPIPWKTKAGFKYAYTPPFVQQLGMFGNSSFDYFSEITRHFRYGTLAICKPNIPKEQLLPRTNFLLDLSIPFTNIVQNYSNDLKKNLKKAYKHSLIFETSNDFALAIDFYKKFSNQKHRLENTYFKKLFSIITKYIDSNNAFIRIVRNNKNEILSTALFLKDEKRIYNILNATSPLGKAQAASHFLIHKVLDEFQNQPLIFDFEGSELKGVKSFYENFRPTNEPYYHFHFNRLPFPFNLVKR